MGMTEEGRQTQLNIRPRPRAHKESAIQEASVLSKLSLVSARESKAGAGNRPANAALQNCLERNEILISEYQWLANNKKLQKKLVVAVLSC